jgi:hypothetical protein
VAVVPGGFGQQSAGVPVAALGDVPAVLLIAGGVLAGGDPEPRRELPRVREPSEVADLSDQSERGESPDPAKAAELLDLPRPPVAVGDVLELGVQGGELSVEAVEMGQHLRQGLVRERVIELLTVDPRAMAKRPRVLAVAEDPAVTQQLFRDAMASRCAPLQPQPQQVVLGDAPALARCPPARHARRSSPPLTRKNGMSRCGYSRLGYMAAR